MSKLLNDLRYAVRTTARSPAFTVVAVLTIGIGIGINSAIFSVVNTVLLRPLPYAEAERLVTAFHFYPSLGPLEAGMAAPTHRELRESGRSFASVAVGSWWGTNFAGDDQPERLVGFQVSEEYFQTLGVPAALGRTISPEEVTQGAPVVVLSDALWRRQFNADPTVIGRTMLLDGEPFEVVGVMPEDFKDPFGTIIELWSPLNVPPELAQGRTTEFLSLVGRLRPEVTHQEAALELAAFAESLKRDNPGQYPPDWSIRMRGLQEQAVGNVRTTLLVLLGAVALVLLIACANIANLLLARASSRKKEVAIRGALGAGRSDLIRQLLVESLFLAALGGMLGLALAVGLVQGLTAWSPPNVPRIDELSLDARVLAFTSGLALLTGVLFGLVPAIQMSRTDLQASLRQGGRGGSETGGLTARRALVVSQVALALTLLVGAGLLVRSFNRLQAVDPGFQPDRLITMQLNLPESQYSSPIEQIAFFEQALERVEQIPGVQGATAISKLPFSPGMSTRSFGIEGLELADGEPNPWGDYRIVDRDFHQVLRIPLLRGRFFSDEDRLDSRPVAIVDQSLAERYWPGQDPIGKRLAFGSGGAQGPTWIEVVGVVGYVKQEGLDAQPRVQIYRPFQQTGSGMLALVARTAGDPRRLVSQIRGAIRDVDPDQPISQIATMDELMRDTAGARRFSTAMLGGFAWIALLLASIGIYGVISFDVTRRTKEMGVRLALGAERRSILRLVIGRGARLIGTGIVIGLAGAFALTRLLGSQLYEVGSADPITYVTVALLLSGVALLATYIPARRATRVDPMIALRGE